VLKKISEELVYPVQEDEDKLSDIAEDKRMVEGVGSQSA